MVGVLLFLIPDLSVTWQVLSWTIFSSVLAVGWFKYLKPLSIDKTKAGLSKEVITGEIGQVLIVPTAEKRGRLRFPRQYWGRTSG